MMDDNVPPPTQVGGKSRVKYAWIFLFKDDINAEDPFSIMPLSFFADVEDFPWTFIEGEMSPECRHEVRSFSNMTGKYRIFGKIEKGKNYQFKFVTVKYQPADFIISSSLISSG